MFVNANVHSTSRMFTFTLVAPMWESCTAHNLRQDFLGCSFCGQECAQDLTPPCLARGEADAFDPVIPTRGCFRTVMKPRAGE